MIFFVTVNILNFNYSKQISIDIIIFFFNYTCTDIYIYRNPLKVRNKYLSQKTESVSVYYSFIDLD